MRLTFGDAKLLRSILAAVSTVVDEVTMRVDPEGLSIKALDLAEVLMVDLSLPKASFEKYEVQGEERVAFRISDVLKLLRSTVPNERVRIEPVENQLMFHVTGAFTRYLGVPIFGGEAKDLPIPKVNLKNTFTVPTAIMGHLVQNGRHVSDSVKFETYEDKVVLSVKGEISSFVVDLLPEDGTLADYALVQGSTVSYDLTRLFKIIPALDFSEKITVAYGEGMPLRISSQIDSKGQVDYFLAPKVER
jgi:proliferating cell nuclear antigen